MKDKILIGVVTANIKDYCWYDFKNQLKRLEARGFDVFIVDNSVRRVNRGFNSISVRPHKEPQVTTAYCMNKIRDYFLDGDWDKLWILESDVFVTDEAVDNLIAMKGDVNNYTYPMRLQRFNKYSLCVQSSLNNKCLMITPEDSQLLLNKGIVKLNDYELNGRIVTHTGYGCTLINRKVVEAIDFKTGKSMGKRPYPDSFFHYDVNRLGFMNLLETDYLCEHRNLNNETKNAIEKMNSGLTRSQRREIERAWKR